MQQQRYNDYMEYALIPDFPAYRVSREGFIETRWRTGPFYNGFQVNDVWKRMRHNERPDGYHGVNLRDGYGRSRRTYVHILVAEAFIGKKPFQKAVVRHLDGVSSNNAASNLAWGTHQQNEDDKLPAIPGIAGMAGSLHLHKEAVSSAALQTGNPKDCLRKSLGLAVQQSHVSLMVQLGMVS